MNEVRMPGTAGRLSPDRIARAGEVIDPSFLNSPCVESTALSAKLGLSLLLKVETFNPIRSFKGRGAEALAAGLEPGVRLVCASSGNFGQGLAWACGRRGLPLRVFTAETASPMKVARMRAFGAEVVQVGDDFDTAKLAGVEEADCAGDRFVEDGRDAEVSEGAGTIGVELGQVAGLDAVVLPVGNGALINGVGTWLRAFHPTTRIYGVCAERAPSMALSWEAGRVVTTAGADTLADGVAIRIPVPEAIADMQGLVDEMVLVSETDIRHAVRLLALEAGVVAEPSGAVGFAAVRRLAAKLAGATVATVVTGGNVTLDLLRDCLGS